MVYRCLECKFETESRKVIRLHVRKQHHIKGKPLRPKKSREKYFSSEITKTYEWRGGSS